MKRVHLVVLWHMHQPQYRDPETGRYVLPWTRLHALKDYWGMVEMLREFPNFHATFNVVPSLGMQLEEYASGNFNEPWFSLAFKNAEELTREDKAEIIARAFQLNQERLMSRWPRLVELHEWSRPAGGTRPLVQLHEPRPSRHQPLLIQLKRARNDFRFILARQFLGVLERQRKPGLVEIAAGVFLQLHAQGRHDVKSGMKIGKLAEHFHHAPVILQRMQARPGEDVAPALRVAVLRLMHVPQQNQMNALHRLRLSRANRATVLHSPFAPCASWTATSSAKFFVTASSDSLSSPWSSSSRNSFA